MLGLILGGFSQVNHNSILNTQFFWGCALHLPELPNLVYVDKTLPSVRIYAPSSAALRIKDVLVGWLN